jgi:hypothetical protein
MPSCKTGAVGKHVKGVENCVASIVHPDGNTVPRFEQNFIEIFRLQVRFQVLGLVSISVSGLRTNTLNERCLNSVTRAN